jgi:hypothetical protein
MGESVSEQRPNAVAPPAAWYPDPGDGTQWRWWSGTAWTDQVAPMTQQPVAAAVSEPGVTTAAGPDAASLEPERRWGTVWVWLLAFSPWLSVWATYFAMTTGEPSNTVSWQSILLIAAPIALVILLAVLDVRQLRRWHGSVAPWAWALLGAPAYVLARTIVLRRCRRFVSVPLWVTLVNLVAALFPFFGLAGLFFFVIVMGIFSE